MWLEHLRAMKQQANISTKELAALSKIPETTLEKIFAGATKDPRLQTVSGIVHALGYTLDDLYPETGITAPSPNLQKVTASMEAMNEDGQSRVVDYADDLVQSGKYNKNASV